MSNNNLIPREVFDLDLNKQALRMAIDNFKVDDVTEHQKVLLYASLMGNRYADLSGLEATDFDGREREIFEAIIRYTGGKPNDNIIVYQLYTTLEPSDQKYLQEEIIQNPILDDYFEIGTHEIRRDVIKKCRDAIKEASSKRKILFFTAKTLASKDGKEAARYAGIIAHNDNPVFGKPFNAAQTFEKRNFIFSYKGASLAQTHNFYNLMGSQKSGKSHIFAVWLSAALFGECCGFKYIGNPNPTILYIDTEQDIADAQEILHTANVLNHQQVDYCPEKLYCISLSQCPRDSIMSLIEEQVELYNPSLIFVDGFGGLVNDVNETKKCNEVVNNLRVMAQAKGATIFGIIHTTPTAQIVKALGVFGSELQRWSAGTFINEKQEGFFKMSAYELRKGGDVQPFYYSLKTCIITEDEGIKKASGLFEYSELQNELNHIGKSENEVEIIAIPTPIDQSEGEFLEEAIKNKQKQEKKNNKEKKEKDKLQAQFCQIFEGSDTKEFTHSELAKKYGAIFGNSDKIASNTKAGGRAIEKAVTLGILYINSVDDKYRYKGI